MIKKLFFRKIKIYTILAIIALLLIALVYLLISAGIEAEYVAENYITDSGGNSPKISKSAFVYDYTVKTGDNTLATISGVNPNAPVSFGSIISDYSDSDLRGLVKNVARAWISKGSYDTNDPLTEDNIVKVGDIYSRLSSMSPPTDKDSLQESINEGYYDYLEKSPDDKTARKLLKIYGTDSTTPAVPLQQYVVLMPNEGSRIVESYRCCCCICEAVSDIAIKASTKRYGHLRAVGLHNTALTEVSDINNAGMSDFYGAEKVTTNHEWDRTIQYPLSAHVDGESTKASALVNSNVIQVGTILMWSGFADGHNSRHVDIVTYIEKNADGSGKIYIAGAANDWRIIADAAWGYDKILEYDSDDVWTTWDECVQNVANESLCLINAVHYKECIRHN